VNTTSQRRLARAAWRKDEAKYTREFLRTEITGLKDARHSLWQIGVHGLRLLAGPVKIRIPETPEEGLARHASTV
jgi:hypothetical protein